MISAYYTGNYYIWIAIEFIFGIIYSFILNWKINQVYPWLKSDIKSGKLLYKKYPEVIKYTKQLFVHRIAGLVQFQTTPFLIYAFVSLQTVAFYGNYSIITDKLKSLFDNFLGSTTAGIGNLIAEGNKIRVLNVYWEMVVLRFLIVGIATFSLYYLLPPFIELWLGSEYLLPDTTLKLILLVFALNILRGTTDQFINGHGLYYDVWAPAVEAVIFITVALIGGSILGLQGILLGSVISLIIIVYGWKPYFLFSKGFKISLWIYWLGFLKLIGLSILTFIIFELINNQINLALYPTDWVNFIIYSLYVSSSLTIIQFILLYVGTEGMKNLVNRFIPKH